MRFVVAVVVGGIVGFVAALCGLPTSIAGPAAAVTALLVISAMAERSRSKR
jgi:hypothetical protein